MVLADYAQDGWIDYDTVDTVYDVCINVCADLDEKEEDNHSRFCNALTKKVQVIRKSNKCTLVCNWTKLIEDNFEKFKAFSNDYWFRQYEDHDEFIYEWIKEIGAYIAGYVSEDMYSVLADFVNTLKS